MRPLSWLASILYGALVDCRNRQYDKGLRETRCFPLPVICIGNLSVGGTGKTPHTEYLIRLLDNEFRLAVLSRGYKRHSRGFVSVQTDSRVAVTGDEPLQMKRKFPHVEVAVCEKRVPGIERLLQHQPLLEAVLLDDAFQHRAITPSLSIVLTDFHRPVFRDHLLPLGRLRESAEGLKRADIIVVTKCPDLLSESTRRAYRDALACRPDQPVLFSRLGYDSLQAMFPEKAGEPLISYGDGLLCRPVLAFCGIGSSRAFAEFVRTLDPDARVLSFSDHHRYTPADARRLAKAFEPIKAKGGLLLATEKDYVHLRETPAFESLQPYLYYVPLRVRFCEGDEEIFNHYITQHVHDYSGKRRMD